MFYYYTYSQTRANQSHACKSKLTVLRDSIPKYLELETIKAQADWDTMALTTLISAAAVLIVLSLLVKSVLSTLKAIRSPLRDIPGPWYAPLTTIHLKWGFSTGEIWKTVEKAHSSYGSIVRLGPRQIWVSDKDALKQILVKVDLPKVAMYSEISRDKLSPGLFGEMYVTDPRSECPQEMFPN